ncbi:MAG: hypothetical protein ABS41_03430 [Arenimonas sp. SCN 70-307]|uniref:TniB family NTP-binding protein n=1 Tax=Arenimonas sp. SCN 70-307 TaxID=1660089 RepID=UPI00086C6A17|nr:TniB family NTP-binding protein [Arenimonas sp. SCN 70-307]ODS64074.1 MAG: hypothetical protein ABS41_03430 [Arenimonas sp. SCN 70-307]
MSRKKELTQYRDIVSRIRIDHNAYADILDELTEAYDAVGTTATPVCLLITGESRTGKSSVVRDLLETYLPTQVDDRTIRTVVYAVAPAKATVKSLLESLLHGLGDPYWSRGSLGNMTQRLYTLLDAVQCKMIILDEFQHLCDKGQKQLLHMLADWLKVLLESRKYGLVAVGLPTAASVVHGHPQLAGRFDDELKMPLFDWRDKGSSAQFRAILRQFQKEVHPFQLPALDSREMALRVFLASAGRIGLVAKLLDRAVRNAVRAGTVNIGLDDLKKAYARAIWSARLFPVPGGPFGADTTALLAKGVQETVFANAALEEVADKSAAVAVYGKNKPMPVPAAAADDDDEEEQQREPPAGPRRARQASPKAKKAKGRPPMRRRPDPKKELRKAL